ncbi:MULTISPECIES: hypothetical protein [unclassified Rhizobium]|uniref:hypothetical protein n=1 Tax=unclassified Rhizobium TaxID=2613769 RepID=UPI000AD836B4|nr:MULTISPECIES: hypothetical protein [unclassified Rhizobium]
MQKYSKVIAATVGGALTGAGTGAVVLPEGSPWYAYVLMALVTAVVPAVVTYFAPKNAN